MELRKSGDKLVVIFECTDKAASVAVAGYVGQLENLISNPYLDKEAMRAALADARDIRDRFIKWQEQHPEEVTYPGQRSETAKANSGSS